MQEIQQNQSNAFQKRQVAYKIDISTIMNCVFQKDELSAGFIQINDNKISRVNLIGTVVHTSEGNFSSATIDDGSGRISLRTFENTGIFSKIEVGDMVLVIGRLREYNNEKYLIPEIVRKMINMDWINVRKKEMQKSIFTNIVQQDAPKIESKVIQNDEIYNIIKELDSGEGAAFEEVVSKAKSPNSEKIIEKLLENGDIFEVKPGKLKVLE